MVTAKKYRGNGSLHFLWEDQREKYVDKINMYPRTITVHSSIINYVLAEAVNTADVRYVKVHHFAINFFYILKGSGQTMLLLR